MKDRIAVTGASGFIGRELCQTLVKEGFVVRALHREQESAPCESVEYIQTGDMVSYRGWPHALQGVSAVVHLAGRAHRPDEKSPEATLAYEQTNVDLTARVADAAVRVGVQRLVFLSTVKVHGERTTSRPFSEEDSLHPVGPYATSKRRAEDFLAKMAKRKDLEVVVIRPPLVYGPGVRANFLRLMTVVNSGVPLPLGLIKNRRSMVGVGNLAAMVVLCLQSLKAAGETFLVSDGEDLSTPQLVRKIAEALDRRCLLVPVPQTLLKLTALVLGKREMMERLGDSLQVETAKAKTLLGWDPPFSFDTELKRTCEWYRKGYRTT